MTHDIDTDVSLPSICRHHAINFHLLRCHRSDQYNAAMRSLIKILLSLSACTSVLHTLGSPTLQVPLTGSLLEANRNISFELFADLEELSRIVDISYCVGVTGTGIQKPFLCASRCQDFPHFELVTVSITVLNYDRVKP